MPSAETEAIVEVSVRIAAEPETVYDFFVDPDKMVQWIAREAQLDPRVGGGLRCDINGTDIASGEYVALEPPRRVVFSWGWEGGHHVTRPGESTVEVLLEPDGEGTLLRLIHRDLPSPDSVERHRKGWTHYLDRLAETTTGRE